MLFSGGRKVFKEPEVIAFRCVVAKHILEKEDYLIHEERDVIVEVWLGTTLKFEEILQAVKYMKSKEYQITEVVPPEGIQQKMYEEALKESRKVKLDYVR